jgi:hypothetical protein
MPFTIEDFQRQYVKEHFSRLTPQEQEELLQSLPPERRLAGLSEEQVRRLLERMAGRHPSQPRKPRRKR